MKALTAEELLCAWEQGLTQPLLQRVLIILLAAFPEMSPDVLVRLSIGQRDLRLLILREQLFGQQLLNSTVCPECGQRIEWENSTADFMNESVENDAGFFASTNEFDLNADDYMLRFRLPNSLDIAAVINSENAEKSQQDLLSRCLLKIEHSGNHCEVSQLPDAVITQLNQEIETLDPHADIQLHLSCPECSHRWEALFDISSFLWAEINDWAEQMLQTVHRLAAGYGWSEQEILNLSPVRRQLYLGMLER